MQEQKDYKSEFGKGTAYCLGLFLSHAERDGYSVGIWFNAASDHLFELEIPPFFPNEIKERLQTLKEKSLEYGHGKISATIKEKNWAINEAKELLYEIDRYLGIDSIIGSWQ